VFTTVFRLATKGHAINGLGRVGVGGNKTHLVFRHKVGTNDRGLPGGAFKARRMVGKWRFWATVAI
jgi:hypothetical protein